MKRLNMLRLFLLILLSLTLAVGCAKKPVEDTTPDAKQVDAAAAEAAAKAEAKKAEEAAAAAAAAKARALEEEAAKKAAETEALLAKIERVHFDFDQYTLTSQAQAILAANATYIMKNPGVKITIEGHCDGRGSDEYNLALGERRALAAKNYLITLGVDPAILKTISYGEEKPLDPADNETAWAKNRRAEFTSSR